LYTSAFTAGYHQAGQEFANPVPAAGEFLAPVAAWAAEVNRTRARERPFSFAHVLPSLEQKTRMTTELRSD
jgi:hypothetical protein